MFFKYGKLRFSSICHCCADSNGCIASGHQYSSHTFCVMEETVHNTGPAMHNKQNRRGRVGRGRQSAFKAEVHLALGTASMKPTVSTSLAAGIANKMLSTFL